MKAYVLNEAGSVENLVLEELEQPGLHDGEVLIQTKAISINPVDVKVRASDDVLNNILGPERPATLGWDIAGKVVAVGQDVTQFEPGDKVFGMVNFPGQGKCYAELVAAPQSHLAKMPENTSYEDAAATTLAALTALQVLVPRVKQGDRVLIHAGSGGVGHFAIQIAKNLGAYVVTTSSAKNKEFVMSLGADEHIDYHKHNFEEATSNIDFVLDGMGGDTLVKSLNVLKDGGQVVSLPTSNFPANVHSIAQQRNIDVSFVLVQSSSTNMNMLKGWLESGVLKPHISHIFRFEDIVSAHRQIESGHTVGKIVVKL